jgi:hypothetical protein
MWVSLTFLAPNPRQTWPRSACGNDIERFEDSKKNGRPDPDRHICFLEMFFRGFSLNTFSFSFSVMVMIQQHAKALGDAER